MTPENICVCAWENKRFAWLKEFCRVKLFVWHLPPLSAASSLFLSIPFFYPSVSRSLFSSFSFFPINEDVKLVPFLWRPAMTEQIRNRKRKRVRRRRNLTSSTLKKRLHHFLSNQQLLQTENFRSRTWEGLFANVCVLRAQRGSIIGSSLPKTHSAASEKISPANL